MASVRRNGKPLSPSSNCYPLFSEVGLIFLGLGTQAGLLDSSLEAGILIMLIGTTFLAPVLLRLVLSRQTGSAPALTCTHIARSTPPTGPGRGPAHAPGLLGEQAMSVSQLVHGYRWGAGAMGNGRRG